MSKEDMIIDLIKTNDQRNREDHQTLFKKIDTINECRTDTRSLSVKEWSIISGIITLVCGTATTIATIIVKGVGV